MFPNVGLPEFIIVMGLAVLLFGKRLPEVARSMGKGIIEFKKGLSGITDELDISGTGSSKPVSSYRSSWHSEEARWTGAGSRARAHRAAATLATTAPSGNDIDGGTRRRSSALQPSPIRSRIRWSRRSEVSAQEKHRPHTMASARTRS